MKTVLFFLSALRGIKGMIKHQWTKALKYADTVFSGFLKLLKECAIENYFLWLSLKDLREENLLKQYSALVIGFCRFFKFAWSPFFSGFRKRNSILI